MRYVKALGLTLIASLSLLALTTSAAHAGELKGDWKLSGVSLDLTVSVNGALYNALESSMLVPALDFAISCHALTVSSGTILPLNGGRAFGHGTAVFSSCLPLAHENLTTLPFCKLFDLEEGVDEGQITAAGLVHVVRSGSLGTGYVLIEPSGAGGLNERTLADVYLNEFCPIEGKILITGTLVAELGKLTLLGGGTGHWSQVLEAEKPLLKEAPHAIKLLFGDQLKFGENDAFLDGDIEMYASGTHAGRPIGIEVGH
jgi:hypothetical protein